MKNNPLSVTIVIPCYNEEKQLQRLWEKLQETAEKITQLTDLRYIFIDDGSIDSTYSLLKELASKNTNTGVIRLSKNTGKEIAVLAGLDHCQTDAAIIMDADLQHPAEQIPHMVKFWIEGEYQIVEVEKMNQPASGLLKKLFSNIFYRLYYLSKGIDLKTSTDFKLLDREVIKIFQKYRNRRRFNRGFIASLDVPVKKLYCHLPPRQDDPSKWSYWKLLKLSWYALTGTHVQGNTATGEKLLYTIREKINLEKS